MPQNSRRNELALSAALGVGYVFCLFPLSVLATWIWTFVAHALYTGGWVSASALPFIVPVLGELVTAFAVAIPFGLVLGLLARQSFLWSCITFFVAAALTTLLTVITVPAPGLSGISLTDRIWLNATSQDFWLFPFAVATVALCVWRWRLGHLSIVRSAP